MHKMFICTYCEKVFKLRFVLSKHYRNVHKQDPTLERGNFKCAKCGQTFIFRVNLSYHERIHKAITGAVESNKTMCPVCGFQSTKGMVIEHFKSAHDIDLQTEEHEFENLEKFNHWKNNLERNSLYVNCPKAIGKGSHGYVRHFYNCHRSGFYNSHGAGVRRMKLQGSNKINGFCPSTINVFVSNTGKCIVYFVATHVGHKCDLSHLPLKKQERDDIAQKMSLKIPHKDILGEVRNSLPNSELQRVHLLKKQDLYNIERDYKLNANVVQHKSEDNGISLCKPQGELCTDSSPRVQAKPVNKAVSQTENILIDLEVARVAITKKNDSREELEKEVLQMLKDLQQAVIGMSIEQLDTVQALLKSIKPTTEALKSKASPFIAQQDNCTKKRKTVARRDLFAVEKKRRKTSNAKPDKKANAIKAK